MSSQDKREGWPDWWLRRGGDGGENVASGTQALVATGSKDLPFGVAMLLAAPPHGRWIAACRTSHADYSQGEHLPRRALALTALGLRTIGLPDPILRGFPAAFVEGMTEPNRSRRLGDSARRSVEQEKWDAVVPEGLRWSGWPTGLPADTDPDGTAFGDGESASDVRRKEDGMQVHALLLVYARSPDELASEREALERELGRHDATVLEVIALSPVDTEPMREHFGFADGMSQPVPYDVDGAEDPWRRPGAPPPRNAAFAARSPGPRRERALLWHGVAGGDILMGRLDGYREIASGPFLGLDQIASPDECDRPATGAAPGDMRDLGWNGSFLVVRQLVQDVSDFWKDMARIGCEIGLSADDVAEKVVGRGKDGKLPRPRGPSPDNDRGFSGHPVRGVTDESPDPEGLGCPIGAHIRRANPRDDGARNAWQAEARLRASNNHRILRRGRPYGPTDQGEVGLLFMCLVTDIVRQFEFTQQTWLLNSQFGGLHQTDPLLGPRGDFSIPADPVRLRPKVRTYVRLAGGEYFFLPGMQALRYLATLAVKDRGGGGG